jgi:hypothetical protein
VCVCVCVCVNRSSRGRIRSFLSRSMSCFFLPLLGYIELGLGVCGVCMCVPSGCCASLGCIDQHLSSGMSLFGVAGGDALTHVGDICVVRRVLHVRLGCCAGLLRGPFRERPVLRAKGLSLGLAWLCLGRGHLKKKEKKRHTATHTP